MVKHESNNKLQPTDGQTLCRRAVGDLAHFLVGLPISRLYILQLAFEKVLAAYLEYQPLANIPISTFCNLCACSQGSVQPHPPNLE